MEGCAWGQTSFEDVIFGLSLAAQDHVEGDVCRNCLRRRAQVGVGPPGEARGATAAVVLVLVRSRAEEGLALDLPVDVGLAC